MSKKNNSREEEPLKEGLEGVQDEVCPEGCQTEQGSEAAEDAGSPEAAPQDLKGQLAELNDKYLRLYSDFDNYRRRANKEKLEMIKTASSGVVLSLLPVIDDMERALKAIRESEEGAGQAALLEGVELIYNKLMGTLKQQGLSECEVCGKPFDAETAEAVAQIPAPEEGKKGFVLDVVQKGYALEGKVLRFAKVVVGC
ncbi:MAG: nucleotide exchange factor GrpE [Bacteroides sp.]|nr:nucleotide exchange factor GrpE [Ruminococcus flavefaciens]MCM1555553.1 nucleotide exchange factor GrpE [Bacteroides sp.]